MRGRQPALLQAAAEASSCFLGERMQDIEALRLMAADLIWERQQNVIQGKIIQALCDRLKLGETAKRELINSLRAQ
jgi:hypothetical protein